MRVRYALWIPVALRLLFPFSVGESPISVMNVFRGVLPEMRQVQTESTGHDADGSEGVVDFETKNAVVLGDGNTAPQNDGGEDAAGGSGQNTPGQTARANHLIPGQVSGMEDFVSRRAGAGDGEPKGQTGFEAKQPYALRLLLAGIWMFGFLAVGGYMLYSRQRFVRYLKKNRSLPADHVLPQAFAKRFLARGVKVYQVQGLPSPCLVGRDIYVGSRSVDDRMSLPHILAHEYSHALHRDGVWAFLRCFLVAVYWFDPLVWAAAYAARQDSELACDEEAVILLGESERFAYGRTLLYLMKNGDCKEECPGMAFMLNRGEKGVKERIDALAACGRKKSAAAVMALLAALTFCGCAFTGAEQDAVNGAVKPEEQMASGEDEEDASVVGDAADDTTDSEDLDKILENAEKFTTVPVETKTVSKEETDQAAFEEALNYRGVMEGKDDSELALNRQVDMQTYYQFTRGKAENPMEKGWYLICEDKDAEISLYGLYTEEFGFRGLKTRIGEDVNTFDGKWCPSYLNSADNIRVLEQAQDGLPRRFVWKQLEEESGTVEIWRFYYANRYDTGTVEVKMLTEEECLSWAKEHLTFAVDQEAAEIGVTYDGDMYLGEIDISAYTDWKTEDVQIVPDFVGFAVDDPGADIYQAYSDAVWEKAAVHLAVGLKFEGVEGLWSDGLPVLTIQIAEDEKSASGFRLGHPRIDETYEVHAPWQEKKLAELRDGNLSAQAASREGDPAQTEWDDPEKPFKMEPGAHHDLEIDFSNPCPDYDHVSAWYGQGADPATGKVRHPIGVDLAAAEGTDILAAADGTVAVTGFHAEMGNYVILWHEQSGQMTYYAHCKTVEVTKGQEVSQGEKIAAVGKTGQATGPCLHFAISSGSNWEEPYFLKLE